MVCLGIFLGFLRVTFCAKLHPKYLHQHLSNNMLASVKAESGTKILNADFLYYAILMATVQEGITLIC